MQFKRNINLAKVLQRKSVLLLGPRRTGKSYYIRHQLGKHKLYDLLHSDQFQQLSIRPSLIRESLTPTDKLIVIDEIQKLPALMDEVHAMIETTGTRFLLTGSSLRKLKRNYTSLMAGRAKTLYLFPLTFAEIDKHYDLGRVLQYGALPSIYLSEQPWDELGSYVGDYLKEEIQAEAYVRKIHNFSRFVRTAALMNGELINFEKVAIDAQVPPRTVREYFSLLEDTLIGTMLVPYQSGRKITSASRKPVAHAKFYFFDLGVTNRLVGRSQLVAGTPEYGRALEHLIFLELKAYLSYSQSEHTLYFWRTQTGQEVDFVMPDRLALEVKSSQLVDGRDLKALQNFSEIHSIPRAIVVANEPKPRKLGRIEILPIRDFLHQLWSGKIV